MRYGLKWTDKEVARMRLEVCLKTVEDSRCLGGGAKKRKGPQRREKDSSSAWWHSCSIQPRLKKQKQNRVQIGSPNREAFLTFHTAGQSRREGGVDVTLLITKSINAEAEGFQSYLTWSDKQFWWSAPAAQRVVVFAVSPQNSTLSKHRR